MTANLSASVHRRSLDRARAEQRPYNDLLHYFTVEHFFYRLGCPLYAGRLVLKGTLMLTAWQVAFPRPTRGFDLLGQLYNAVEQVVAAVDISASNRWRRTTRRTGAVHGLSGHARVPMQIDVGFGDAVAPAPIIAKLTALLDYPAPEVRRYTRESVIAEKMQSMVALDDINSRMKDFSDIWLLPSVSGLRGGRCPRLSKGSSPGGRRR